MENQENKNPGFNLRMTRREATAVLLYLPLHVFALPLALAWMFVNGGISEADANFVCYAIGTGYVLATCWGYLRRDFDPLFDNPFRVVAQVFAHYGLMFVLNILASILLTLLLSAENNPNNAAVGAMLGDDYGKVAAMTVFLAPIMEEVIFRGAIFGGFRQINRKLAYIVSIALFSMYHVWGYMILDWRNIVYVIQYIPVSFLLCRVYEKTDTIWASIFFHMMVNGVSVNALSTLEGMLG